MKINNFSLQGASLDGIILAAVKIVTIGLGLITTRLLSQYLSIFDYGTYSLIQLVVSSTVSITILGMMDGINYFFCSEKDEGKRDAYIATIYLLQFSVSLLAGCVIVCAGGQICLYLGTAEARRLMIYAAVLPFLQNILSMTQVLMLSVGKAKVLAVRNLVISLLRLLIVILVIVFVGSVGIILFMTCILDAAQIIVFFFMLKKSGCIVHLRKASIQLLRPIIHYCLPMAVYTALNTINRDCDKYIIAAMTNTETLAVYTNASKKLPFDLITSSFITVLLPKITRLISNKEEQETVKVYRAFLEFSYSSTIILACGAIAAAPQLMNLLYTEKYLSGISIFVVYILVDIMQFTNITLILSASGKAKTLMLLSGGSIVLNIGMNFLLFHLLGVIGPAIATLLITSLTGAAILYFSAKKLGTRITGFFDFRYLIRLLAENIAAVTVLACLRNLLESAGLNNLLILLLICGTYYVILLALNKKRLIVNLKEIG